MFAQRRRKYKNNINVKMGKKKLSLAKRPVFRLRKLERFRDSVLIKFIDGIEYLITDRQFFGLMLHRRKQDAIWRTILSIKNLIPTQMHDCKSLITKYNRNQIKYEQLQKRSRSLMRVYGQNIIKGEKQFITEQEQQTFCKNLQLQSNQIYGHYLCYKIVNFIQQFYDQKINKVVIKLIINEIGECYLQDVLKLQTQQLIKYDWTEEIYEKKKQEEQQKIFLTKQIDTSSAKQKNTQQIEMWMNDNFEKLKEYYGLSIVEQDHHEQNANNEFFRSLYPKIRQPISQLLSDKNLTVQKFKRVYLQQKPIKKSIIRPFTNSMMDTFSQFNQNKIQGFITSPNTTGSTLVTCRTKKKSLSVREELMKYGRTFNVFQK